MFSCATNFQFSNYLVCPWWVSCCCCCLALNFSQVLASSVYHPQKDSIIKFMIYTHAKRQKTQNTYKKESTYTEPAIIWDDQNIRLHHHKIIIHSPTLSFCWWCTQLAQQKAILHCVIVAESDKCTCSTNGIFWCTSEKKERLKGAGPQSNCYQSLIWSWLPDQGFLQEIRMLRKVESQ